MKKFRLVLIVLAMLFALAPAALRTNAQSGTPAPTEGATVDKTGWPDTFIIGVYPGDNIDKALSAAKPLADYMTKMLGVYTTVITGTSYNAVVEAMRAGRADAFEVGPFSYLLAAQIAGAEAIAVGNYNTTVDLKQLPGYYSVMFTKKGSGIKSIADLKGKTFSFTDPASTSGYLVPAVDIMNAMNFDSKDQLTSFFGQSIFAGNHPASVLAVANGKVDAGASFDDNLVDQVKAGVKICGISDGTDYTKSPFRYPMTDADIQKIYDACPDGNIAIFHQSPLIPQTPFAINSKLPQSFKDAVKAALLNLYKDDATIKALGRYYVDPTTIDSSLKSVDSLYDPLRVIAKKLNLDLTKS